MIIINQGDSDLFVRATAEERKIMIEEILGPERFVHISVGDVVRSVHNEVSTPEGESA